ncbi:PAS domain S-box-containing protein [Clostridium punense]|uniref:histidine kinase n=1 Tax=Clostridium punense TaxID=1054297 RepID=A0ABS4K3R1_9CLOT|nr:MULTISPECIES: ATP-binding protein [Clostridium]EQB89700.1 hypothetical protein M918_19530 [Clostridium sp. BL8]MBP2022415.1 PAS domain S-box-containing protein [Clostridium punense]
MIEFLYIVGFIATVAILLRSNLLYQKKITSCENLLLEKDTKLEKISLMENNGFTTIVEIDSLGNIKYISEKLLNKLAYSYDELINQSFNLIHEKDDYSLKIQNYYKLINKEIDNFTIDNRLISKEGKHIWFSCSYALLNEDNDVIIYCVDIDWRKQVEKSLRQSYELNELLLNSIETKVAAFDSNGDIIAVNRAMEELCLDNNIFRGPQLIDNFFSSYVGTTDNSKFLQNRDVLNNVKQVFNGNMNKYSFEYYYIQDFKKYWYLLTVKSLENGLGGVASYTDITRLKELEESLVKNEERYKNLLEILPVGIFVHDKNGVVYCNQSALKLLELENPGDILGQPLLNFVDLDYKIQFISRFTEGKSQFISGVKEVFVNSKNEKIHVEIEQGKILFEDETMTLFIVKDITEKINTIKYKNSIEEKDKQLQEALQYDKIKTEFFANISHELRTPINIIFSAIQVLNLKLDECGSAKPHMENYLSMVKQNCYRLLRLVNNLIDITKIDSGFLNIQTNNYDIVGIVENITLSVAQYIENRNVSLVFDTNVEEKIMAFDPDKMERIILNLLANAVKFTSEGGEIAVTITDKEDEVCISVRDTGIGIPEDKLKVIFERFRQVDKTLSRNREGSGIGLSLVKSLIELHGGTIELFSEYGKGSEFIITLPVKFVQESFILSDTNFWQENVEKINLEFSDIYA